MSHYFKNIQPGLASDESDDDELSHVLRKQHERDDQNSESDEFSSLTFGSLKQAADMLHNEEDNSSSSKRKLLKKREVSKSVQESMEPVAPEETDHSFDDEISSSDAEAGFFESEDTIHPGSKKKQKKKKIGKHAPKEHSAKKPVSRIRQIEGLENPKQAGGSQLYEDIRFDRSMGKEENFNKVRDRYRFLDEYREKEISDLRSMLADRKLMSKVSDHERENIQARLTSLTSKLQSIQNRDLEAKIIKEYEQQINQSNKSKFHLKKSEKRKIIQKWKFDHMKSKQREKVMERKRKKIRGKEFKNFEFHKG
ncbi:rRNA-processing protein RRP36 Ecym_6254 [Eremothecium cymbalariae DBVPG|uniref:rRNA biogenesis protein RRP36 n=1 Tax=Eremothecium cymbalariae (strain CBS 270.75 / DBVPG 7215 / KCTC 17166 / NRRL Y-17582) TaxID=931890 RepID=G8JVF7_ERECY|nr:hypothetical protein Ecym_6254 [Eremothecium cymbalariae DBVPG\